ncbi:purine-cytosine permease family protein [Nannocystis pusilla]|uniref:Cytosine permease n=1 Tax=Nannocystis pusilla TaxID=889268 RepID=A0ABS7TR70_9BACT|nr:cytosine permease [Nannocystis pusilla]MBZ5710722.1 cytosine permease [Nannocystis pusilla]
MPSEATFGTWPVLRVERVWGFGDFLWVSVGLAIATWAFLSGGATAALVGFRDGVAATILGNAVGVALALLAGAVPCQRYGVEQYTLLRSVFGARGSALLVFTIILIDVLGWSGVLAVMFGRAAVQVGNAVLGASWEPNGWAVTGLGLLALALAWWMFAGGPWAIRALNRIISPALAVLTLVMFALLLTATRWETLLGAPPLAPAEGGPWLNFMLAVELNIGVGISWWPVIGNLARLTRDPRTALWAAFLGLFPATVVAQVVGLVAALALGSADPTAWMIPLGGVGLGLTALVFIAVANLTSLTSIAYGTCVALRQSSASLARLDWRRLGALFFAAASALCFAPALLYDHFLAFVTWTGAALAALSGTILADYYVLRRQQIALRGLYIVGPASLYHYWRGYQLAAFLATGLGLLAYVALYDPQTLAHAPLFMWLTASGPAVIVAGVSRLLMAPIMDRRAGRPTPPPCVPRGRETGSASS